MCPQVTGSGQSLENPQLSRPAEVKAVVCGQVRRLSVKGRLKERLFPLSVPKRRKENGRSSDLRGEDAGRQRNRSQEETVDVTEDGGIYRRQEEVKAPLLVYASKHTWKTCETTSA